MLPHDSKEIFEELKNLAIGEDNSFVDHSVREASVEKVVMEE